MANIFAYRIEIKKYSQINETISHRYTVSNNTLHNETTVFVMKSMPIVCL